MVTIIALVLKVLMVLIPAGNSDVVTYPERPTYSADELFDGCECEQCTNDDAYDDAWCEFTNLFNSYETKRAKNGALMIRRGNSGSFKFAKKG